MKNLKSIFVCWICLLIFPLQIFSQEQSALVFFRLNKRKDYNFAVTKAREVYNELKNQDYPFALEATSVVFPELIRYSEFQDQIEALMNELMAITTEESSGFSIGYFQMKPSFASQVEQIISFFPELKSKYPKIDFDGDLSTASARHDRIVRLKKMDFQIEYLKAFVDFEIMNLDLENETMENRIMYLGAAYNAGIQFSKKGLERYFTLTTFPSGKKGLYFNYPSICVEASKLIGK